MSVTLDGVLDWILDLLTTYTHDSELQVIGIYYSAIANFHTSQFTTVHVKSFLSSSC
jgi:hypothetical protein